MNRRPQQSRSQYDAFSPRHTARFTASTPDARFFEPRKNMPFSRRILLLALAALLLVAAGNFIANRFIRLDRVSVPIRGLPESFDGYTLLHISDLKGESFGSSQRALSLALNKARYDAVVITGDMISARGNAQPFYALLDVLRSHDASAPIYFIPGDSDPVPASAAHFAGGSPFAPWVLGAQQRGAQLLSSPQAIRRGAHTVWLATGSQLSLDIDAMQKQFELQYIQARSSGGENEIELATYNLKWLEETRAARSDMQEGDTYIALAHAPLSGEELALNPLLSRIHLLLCGHYLGGMLRLPMLGPLFVPSASLPRYGILPGDACVSGLRREGRAYVYTSSGLGSSVQDYPALFFRLFNPPSVSLITLTPSSL
ncbi:MAG: metallophosphoesterase [Clostridia bacterium]|nr:metallophosphoesterase [Clostridia bacterium]